MNWYLQNGKDSDVVISSRIRLARNIADIPFITKCDRDDFKKVHDLMKNVTLSIGYGLQFIDMKDLDDITKEALSEKRLISREFAKNKNPYAAIMINSEENICITINEEDHIKLQAFASGLDVENLMNLCIEIDQKLEEEIPYSFHNQYGYLTACPTNVGTGLKASVIVHLPALSTTKNIGKVVNIVNNLGMSLKETSPFMYQISNNQTLGITEKEIIKNLNLITQKVLEQERALRKYLCTKSINLEDKVYRDFGVVSNARKLGLEESRDLLSNIKLGVDLGIIEELDDTKVSELMIYTMPANLQKRIDKQCSGNEQDIERARICKEIIGKE